MTEQSAIISVVDPTPSPLKEQAPITQIFATTVIYTNKTLYVKL